MRLLFEGGFYSRAAFVRDFTVFTSPLAVDLTVVDDLEDSCIESRLHVIIL